MNVVLKNRRGMVRSGWIIALCLLAYNALIYSLTDWAGAALGAAADAANLDAASYAAFVEWMNGPEMYLAIQFSCLALRDMNRYTFWDYLFPEHLICSQIRHTLQ